MSFTANQATKVQKNSQLTHTFPYYFILGHGDGSFVPKYRFFGTKEPSPCPMLKKNDYFCMLK